MYKDYRKYEGTDRYAAMGITTGGAVVSVGAGAFLTVIGTPVVAGVIISGTIGVGVAYGVDYIKDKVLGD